MLQNIIITLIIYRIFETILCIKTATEITSSNFEIPKFMTCVYECLFCCASLDLCIANQPTSHKLYIINSHISLSFSSTPTLHTEDIDIQCSRFMSAVHQ